MNKSTCRTIGAATLLTLAYAVIGIFAFHLTRSLIDAVNTGTISESVGKHHDINSNPLAYCYYLGRVVIAVTGTVVVLIGVPVFIGYHIKYRTGPKNRPVPARQSVAPLIDETKRSNR